MIADAICLANWTALRWPREQPRLAALAVAGTLLGLGLLATDVPARATPRLDLAAIAATWNADFRVDGLKTEPTFVEDVHYARDGDRFTLLATIDGQSVADVSLDLGPTGSVSLAACPRVDGCLVSPPNGFLSTVAVLAALRAGQLRADGEPARYAGRDAVCVALEAIQPAQAGPVVMDPCFDLATGAVLAQRRRFDGQFGGATLDEASLRLVGPLPSPIRLALSNLMPRK